MIPTHDLLESWAILSVNELWLVTYIPLGREGPERHRLVLDAIAG
jgi:hypothetical protein